MRNEHEATTTYKPYFYYPHQPEVDRPMLAYLKGSKGTLAIDAGYSASHVEEFYEHLEQEGLRKPDFTVITHWHYDHTFGMHHIHGHSIAHQKTNEYLEAEREKAMDPDYMETLRREDPCFEKEYRSEDSLKVVLADLTFQTKLNLHLGGITAHIFHTESPHSEDTVCIYVPEEKVLFLGDATSEDFFHDGYMDQRKLKKLVEMIEKTDCIYCVLSHCEPLKKEELLSYLETVAG